MATKKMRETPVKQMARPQMTLVKLPPDRGGSKTQLRPTISVLRETGRFPQVEGHLREVAIAPTHKRAPALSETEQRIVELLQNRKNSHLKLRDITEKLGSDKLQPTLDRLLRRKIIEQKGSQYRITSVTELNIPLTAAQRQLLVDAEKQIDVLIDGIEASEIEVAVKLKMIRDEKLYRETHKTFKLYIEQRHNRCRDWAYKKISSYEVKQSLLGAGVEATLQSVTSREMTQLARLKCDAVKMRTALTEAESAAEAEGRSRTLDDVKRAVESAISSGLPTAEPDTSAEQDNPRTQYLVKFIGIEHSDTETDDLPKMFGDISRWLKGAAIKKKFSVTVTLKAK